MRERLLWAMRYLAGAMVLCHCGWAAAVIIDVPRLIERPLANFALVNYSFTTPLDCTTPGCPRNVLVENRTWSTYAVALPEHPDKTFLLVSLGLYLNGGDGYLTLSDGASHGWDTYFPAAASDVTTFAPNLFLATDFLYVSLLAAPPPIPGEGGTSSNQVWAGGSDGTHLGFRRISYSDGRPSDTDQQQLSHNLAYRMDLRVVSVPSTLTLLFVSVGGLALVARRQRRSPKLGEASASGRVPSIRPAS